MCLCVSSAYEIQGESYVPSTLSGRVFACNWSEFPDGDRHGSTTRRSIEKHEWNWKKEKTNRSLRAHRMKKKKSKRIARRNCYEFCHCYSNRRICRVRRFVCIPFVSTAKRFHWKMVKETWKRIDEANGKERFAFSHCALFSLVVIRSSFCHCFGIRFTVVLSSHCIWLLGVSLFSSFANSSFLFLSFFYRLHSFFFVGCRTIRHTFVQRIVK